jgi:hypothetical protein
MFAPNRLAEPLDPEPKRQTPRSAVSFRLPFANSVAKRTRDQSRWRVATKPETSRPDNDPNAGSGMADYVR